MSRIANNPVVLPDGVAVKMDENTLFIQGAKGELCHALHALVSVTEEDTALKVKARQATKPARALAGTTRALLQNMVIGVSVGFERKLEIVGVGYRARAQGKTLNLALGFSRPVDFPIPDGISIETPSQTEIVIRGIDKQQVGQVAANIRRYRPPEPYKGKGVRYAGERIIRKEAKKA